MMQQRKDEIQAKKAKLAELKRQRELRQQEFAAGRQSLSTQVEVRLHLTTPGQISRLIERVGNIAQESDRRQAESRQPHLEPGWGE